jgi:hypothetical protein
MARESRHMAVRIARSPGMWPTLSVNAVLTFPVRSGAESPHERAPAIAADRFHETSMPRFYFHFASKDRFVHDDQGADLEGLATAHLHALRLILRTLRFMDGGEPERWTVQVADGEGHVRLTVLFPSADRRESTLGRRPRAPAGFPVGASPEEDTPAALRGYAAALRAATQSWEAPAQGH